MERVQCQNIKIEGVKHSKKSRSTLGRVELVTLIIIIIITTGSEKPGGGSTSCHMPMAPVILVRSTCGTALAPFKMVKKAQGTMLLH